MKKIHEPFVRCFIKGWKNLTIKDNNDLSKRKKQLDCEFVFAEEIIGEMIALNKRLQKEELRIRPFSEKLVKILEQQVKEKVIDDYNFESVLEVFSNDEFYKQLYNRLEGNPIWEDTTYLLFSKHNQQELYTDNWNEFEDGHPLGKIFFCYSMHCIFFHSQLAWEDILRIDDIWIDLKVEYQFSNGLQ